MAAGGEKLRILIPTTSGPVEVVLLTEEDSIVGRSVACIGGTTETADIAAAYHAFVARPTGVIESLFGHSCYRLDLSSRIDAGASWQLGVLAAHALHAAGRLAQEKDEAHGVVWATGSVRSVDLTVGGVGHVPEKLAGSLDRLKREAAAGGRVLLALPADNASEVPAPMRADLAAHGIKLIELTSVQPLWDRLEIKLPEGFRKNPAAAAKPAPSAPKRSRWWAVAAVLLCVAAGAAYLFARPDAIVAERAQTSDAPPVQRTAELLLPETVPFISDRDRVTVRTAYLPAPDHKALAVSYSSVGFSTAQQDDESAGDAAIAACQRATDAVRARSRCELYAVGNTVVFKRGRPPLPPQPWIVRDASVESAFAAAEVPLVSDASRRALEDEYAKARKPKALAVSANGFYSPYTSVVGIEEAARRALERCGSNSGLECLIVAIDDAFVVPIPKSTKVFGISRLESIDAIAPELRGDAARRFGNSTSGWRALAIGTSGRVGIAVNAATEQAATDGALEDCRRLDRDCRVAVIGPFLVESRPAPDLAASRPGAGGPSAIRAAISSAIPGLSAAALEDLTQGYETLREHKSLAVVPGTSQHWRSQGWPDAEAAETGVLERCQARNGQPCALIAVDDRFRTAAAEGNWQARDMARLHYDGLFDPKQIPGITEEVRTQSDIAKYRGAAGPKAAAFHPWGRVFTIVNAPNQHMAELLALANCNADPTRQGRDGPCQLYALGDQVVLPRRRIEPLTP
jgi:hypothetical protein